MPAYLVRTINDQDLVGVFFATSIRDLAWLVDEAVDPDLCEYIRLGPGGVIWTEPSIKIPTQCKSELEVDWEAEEPPIPWSGASFTEVWGYSTYRQNERKWKPIDLNIFDLCAGELAESSQVEPPRPEGRIQNSKANILPFTPPRKSEDQ
ncbi:hypothetical protein [Bradyrhizobium oligotrophicum]|uniref:hypothetical protein n=1 Tax=Bradyrhizobium oligotrophicum TaxID=44255 RepID=UPI003EBFA62D